MLALHHGLGFALERGRAVAGRGRLVLVIVLNYVINREKAFETHPTAFRRRTLTTPEG